MKSFDYVELNLNLLVFVKKKIALKQGHKTWEIAN
jgi:hypothetical protein